MHNIFLATAYQQYTAFCKSQKNYIKATAGTLK